MAYSNDKKSKEIDWIEILHKIWSGRKTILITVFIFLLIGIVDLIFSPKEYKSEETVLIETSSTSGILSGLLQQFGGIAGMNIDKKTKEALIPELYPEVIFSSSFLLELLDEKIIESEYDSIISVSNYLNYHTRNNNVKGYTIGLPQKIIKLLKGTPYNSKKADIGLGFDSISSLINVTQNQYALIESLRNRITTEQDFKKNNKITVTVEMQDPKVAAQINFLINKKLEEYIIKYRTQKAQSNLDFIAKQYEEAKSKYIDAQEALADYRDKNKNIILASVKTEEDRLEAEYNLTFELFTTISQQLEQAKIQVQENTPVIIVMDPANIPIEKDEPKTIFTLVVMIFIGGLIGLGLVFGKPIYKKFRSDFASFK